MEQILKLLETAGYTIIDWGLGGPGTAFRHPTIYLGKVGDAIDVRTLLKEMGLHSFDVSRKIVCRKHSERRYIKIEFHQDITLIERRTKS